MSKQLSYSSNKTALVTGASSGIGLAFARALANEGWSLILVARRKKRLEEIIENLPGRSHEYIVADLSTPEGIGAVTDRMVASPPRLLINNAGNVVHGKFHESILEQQQEMMRLNIDALVTLSKVFLQRASAGDALINVASTLATLPYPTSAVYAASKAFTLSLSESLWFEQKDRGVYVMAICPGSTSTELHAVSGAKEPPASVTQTPEQVVAEAMAGLRLRKNPTIVSGGKNRMAAFITRFLSRKAVVSMMGAASKKAANA